jgi:endoglucanase
VETLDDAARDLLWRLLGPAGPAAYERPAAELWRTEAHALGLDVSHDLLGNSVAHLPGSGPRVALVGHIDELGLMITHIDDDGFLWFSPIGGWDEQVLVGHRVVIATRQGPVIGLIGRTPIHLLRGDDRDKAARARDLWIDIGARDGAEARARVRPGDVAVLALDPIELPNNRLAARAIDNRVGAFIALQTLRLLAADPPTADVYAIASVREEIGAAGAAVSGYSLAPTVAIAIDVTFATDVPNSDKRGQGDHAFGSGPVIARGGPVNPIVVEHLIAAAEAESIPYTIEANPRSTSTDADPLARAAGGIAAGAIFVPSRYMHTPNETICLDDVAQTARLLAAFIRRIEPEADFRP